MKSSPQLLPLQHQRNGLRIVAVADDLRSRVACGTVPIKNAVVKAQSDAMHLAANLAAVKHGCMDVLAKVQRLGHALQ